MSRQIISQNSFNSGEISPNLYSRADIDEYKKGLETATNVTLAPYGPVKKRNGSKFIAQVKDSSASVRLIKYQFSTDVAHVIEIGNQYMRFYTTSSQIVESDLTITGITQANPAVVTSTSHGLSNGDQVYITEVVGMTEINSATVPYTVANVTTNTFELSGIDSTGYTAYSSAGVVNNIYEITSPYTTAQLDGIQYTQSGASMYLVHPDVSPRKLTKTSNTDWTLEEIDFYPPPTYESGYEPDMTITPAATTGLSINFTSGSALFLEGDIGRQITNLSTGETGRASIVSITSTTVAVCDIIEDFTNTDAIASGDWKLDLSPIVDLEFDGTQAGSIVNIRSEFPSGSLGSRFNITGITNANPGVVTTSASHGYVNGDRVVINDVKGMTQLNGNIYTVANKTATTFELTDDNNNNLNTTNYTTYSSGGITRLRLTGINIDAFRAADVGRYILANGGVMQIVAVTAADDIDAEVIKSLNSKDTTGNWSLEEATWSSTRGYPRSIGFYEQRLVFAGTSSQPQSVWMSEIGIFDGFGAGPDDEDSIDIELSSNQVNEISWIASGRDLVIGTSGGEITLSSGSSSSISPSSIQQLPRTYIGSDVQQVQNIREEILFIQKSARKIRTFRYDFNIDGYQSEDLTFLSEHITEGGIEELVYAQEPDTVVYVVTTNGSLLAGTYDRGLSVIGWSKFETDGDYENVTSITNDEADDVWTVVKRKVNGSTVRYIELLTDSSGTDDLDSFSDSHLQLSDYTTITSVTNANPAVVTSTAHGISNGDKVIIKDLLDPYSSELDSSLTNMSSLNNCTFTAANVTANTLELTGVDTSNYNAYGSAGNIWKKVTSVSGLDHLEGKTVQIKADGAVLPSETVSNGSITLDSAAGEVVVGLPYTMTIKTLGAEFDTGIGSSQGQRVRWSRPLIRVYKSTRPLVNGEYLPNRNADDLMDKKLPLYSGYLEYGSLDWSNSTALTITNSEPLPVLITGITGSIDSGVK